MTLHLRQPTIAFGPCGYCRVNGHHGRLAEQHAWHTLLETLQQTGRTEMNDAAAQARNAEALARRVRRHRARCEGGIERREGQVPSAVENEVGVNLVRK